MTVEEIQQLESLQTAVLREMFREIVGVSSRPNNRASLTRRIAYVLQARAELAAMTSSAGGCAAPDTAESRDASSAGWPGLDVEAFAPQAAIMASRIPRMAGLPARRPVYPVPARPAGSESEAGGEPRVPGGARAEPIQAPSTASPFGPTTAVPGAPGRLPSGSMPPSGLHSAPPAPSRHPRRVPVGGIAAS